MKINTLIIKVALTFIPVFVMTVCTKYYSSAPVTYNTQSIDKKIPVNVELTQKDWSIVIKLPDATVQKNVTDVLFDNPVFVEETNATKKMKIDILHHNDNGSVEIVGAMLTGASFYVIPSRTDSDVDITISMDDITTKYTGEMGVVGGLVASSLIDEKKYTKDNPMNLMKNLIKNAVGQFTENYLKQHKL